MSTFIATYQMSNSVDVVVANWEGEEIFSPYDDSGS